MVLVSGACAGCLRMVIVCGACRVVLVHAAFHVVIVCGACRVSVACHVVLVTWCLCVVIVVCTCLSVCCVYVQWCKHFYRRYLYLEVVFEYVSDPKITHIRPPMHRVSDFTVPTHQCSHTGIYAPIHSSIIVLQLFL